VKIVAKDCSPLVPQPNSTEVAWLRKLVANFRAADFTISVAGDHSESEPIVYCAWDGIWWAGRYVGSISFEGNTLSIIPRFGLNTIKNWLFEATSVVLTESHGQLREDESFIAQLLAVVWVQGFVEAARHGLPALRNEVSTKGPSLRGRLDVRESIHLIASSKREVVSIRSEKSLDHAASEAIVAAYGVLRLWLGIPDEQWMPARLRDLLPQLIAVTGQRPRVPTKATLERIRYTPITRGFALVAELSRQIANRRGLAVDAEANGETTGVLLDVAELWERYVLSVLRKSVIPFAVKHGTHERDASKLLLQSEVNGQGLGKLIPDGIVHKDGYVFGILDAKYKSLYPSVGAPHGPQREDLYQMTAYLGRFAPIKNIAPAWGVLAYPEVPGRPEIPLAESLSPWLLGDGKKIYFTTLPHDSTAALVKLRDLIEQLGAEKFNWRATG